MGFFDDIADSFRSAVGSVDSDLLTVGTLGRADLLGVDTSGTTMQFGNGVPNSALPLLFPGSQLHAKLGDGPNDVVVDESLALGAGPILHALLEREGVVDELELLRPDEFDRVSSLRVGSAFAGGVLRETALTTGRLRRLLDRRDPRLPPRLFTWMLTSP